MGRAAEVAAAEDVYAALARIEQVAHLRQRRPGARRQRHQRARIGAVGAHPAIQAELARDVGEARQRGLGQARAAQRLLHGAAVHLAPIQVGAQRHGARHLGREVAQGLGPLAGGHLARQGFHAAAEPGGLDGKGGDGTGHLSAPCSAAGPTSAAPCSSPAH
jgi:hypothetical protein